MLCQDPCEDKSSQKTKERRKKMEKRSYFGETEAEEEKRRRAIEDIKGRGRGRGKEKPPWRPLGIGDLKIVPHECWHEDSDGGVPKYYHKADHPFTSYVGYAADELVRQNGISYDDTEDKREMNRDPEWDPRRVAQAGAKLIETLELSPTRAMCDVVGAYMGRG